MNDRLDLVVLVADADAEWTIRTLLEKRQAALQIRAIQSKFIRDPGRDAGTFLNAPTTLRSYLGRANHVLVMLDREGSGREQKFSAEEMEADLEKRLQATGWADAVAIVLDPELEIWVWSRSPHVALALGLSPEALATVLAQFAQNAQGKPERPKEAMLAALRQSKRPHSPRIFQELAGKVSLRANERAFDRLRTTLQSWFGAR